MLTKMFKNHHGCTLPKFYLIRLRQLLFASIVELVRTLCRSGSVIPQLYVINNCPGINKMLGFRNKVSLDHFFGSSTFPACFVTCHFVSCKYSC